jgi:hypothetical protein
LQTLYAELDVYGFIRKIKGKILSFKEISGNVVSKALHGIGIISFLCFIINTPHFFTYNPVLDRNATDGTYKLTEFGRGVGSQNYEFWVHCMFLVLVPWVTIFTLNMLIIRQVWASGDKKHNNKYKNI